MTNKEAIEELRLLESEERYDTEYTDFECFRLAIRALEQQDKERWIPVSEGLPEEREEEDEDETILDVIKHNTSLEMAYFIEKMYKYIEEGKFKTTNDIQDYLDKKL